jgi:glycosyltransferase involved in cell wall biosynthesis
LLPDRLSYPEIMPRKFHSDILFQSEKELGQKLARVLERPDLFLTRRRELSAHAAVFSWESIANMYDKVLEKFENCP